MTPEQQEALRQHIQQLRKPPSKPSVGRLGQSSTGSLFFSAWPCAHHPSQLCGTACRWRGTATAQQITQVTASLACMQAEKKVWSDSLSRASHRTPPSLYKVKKLGMRGAFLDCTGFRHLNSATKVRALQETLYISADNLQCCSHCNCRLHGSMRAVPGHVSKPESPLA